MSNFCGMRPKKFEFYKGGKMKEDLIERLGYGVMADSEEMPNIFSHSDRFLIIDLKNRKEIVFEEYRKNPHAKIIKKKYPMPTPLGDSISDEEFQLYMDIAEILKDCKYVNGKNLGYFPKTAMEKLGIFYVMKNVDESPRDDIKGMIEDRALAGFRD
jgi:hypothetical protein